MNEREPDDRSRNIRRRFKFQFGTELGTRVRPTEKRSSFRTDTEAEDLADRRALVSDYQHLKGQLQERLLERIGQQNLLGGTDDEVSLAVQEFVEDILRQEDLPLNEVERGRLAEELTEETLGLGPLAPLLADPAVSDILVNRPEQIYVERAGRLEPTNARFRDGQHILRVIERIASWVGRRIDAASPMLDARLPDGSRVNATIPPVSLDGPTLSIRRFGRTRLRRDDLVRLGEMNRDMVKFLEFAVTGRKNILISGGTGAGKSTLLGAVCEVIPNEERIITIEDTAELILDQEHVVRLESRPPNIEGTGRITTRDLLMNSLRMRPDRIIVGEVRGAEALDMLQALNTGHDGGVSTVHANSPRDAISRLETMVLMAGMELPMKAVREQIVSALELIVHVRRYEDGKRRVESIVELIGLEGSTPLMQEVYRYKRRGRRGRAVLGDFESTGIVPRMVEDLTSRGYDIPVEMFRKSGGGGS